MNKHKRVWLALVFLLIFKQYGYAGDISEHFFSSEFRCKCGCGTMKVDQKLVKKLEKLRNMVHGKVSVTSGYRCSKHNIKVGGVRNSQHTKGKASDIKVSGISQVKLAQYAKQCGFSYIKVYKSWIHVDVR